MKKACFFFLASMVLFLNGCTRTINTMDRPVPKAVNDVEGVSVNYMTPGDSDGELAEMVKAIALEGKKRGYGYFAVLYPGALNNIQGSPITTMSELLTYCQENTMTENRKNCQGLIWFGMQFRMKVFYLKSPQPDYLVWNIDELLKEPVIADANGEYDIDPEYTRWERVKGRNFPGATKLYE